jgi:hypothetical protein
MDFKFDKYDTNKYLTSDQLGRVWEQFEIADNEDIMSAWYTDDQLYIEIWNVDTDETTVYEPDLSDEEGQRLLDYIMNGNGDAENDDDGNFSDESIGLDLEEEAAEEDMLVTSKETLKEHAGVREITDKVYEAVENGMLTWEMVATAALAYMSEDDVADMARVNDWFTDEIDDASEFDYEDDDDISNWKPEDEDEEFWDDVRADVKSKANENLQESAQAFAREIFDLTLQSEMMNANVVHNEHDGSVSITESKENLEQLDVLIEGLASQKGKTLTVEKTDFTHTYRLS